jgi:hypothetical protein
LKSFQFQAPKVTILVYRNQGKSGFENSFSGQKAANTVASAFASLGGFVPASNGESRKKINH